MPGKTGIEAFADALDTNYAQRRMRSSELVRVRQHV
jgi:hypothetical protein